VDYTAGDVVERVRELAADHGVDAAFDLFGGEMQERALDLLRPGGRIVSVIAPPQPRDHVESHYVFVRPSGYDLAEMNDLIAAGRLKPHVEQTFPLDRAAEAMERLEDGHVRGKLVLEID
jgi:NADPH:quinone reductase-like Zn-dependent oxidoreductase